MITRIGIPKEVKTEEYRVSVTPAGVKTLTQLGHKVYVQRNAGLASSFADQAYTDAGAIILENAQEVFDHADLIVKVKEPIESEYKLIKSHHTLFTYFHFAASQKLTDAMLNSKATCIAYETVTDNQGTLPLLVPMSQVAGRLAAQFGAHYLLKPMQGKGKLIGGVPGSSPANVVVLGGGIVGTESARIAAGMGANVFILDINQARLDWLSDNFPSNVSPLLSTKELILELIPKADIIIGAVLIPGGKAPHLITKAMLSDIENGTVLLDVAVDQGGCIESVEPTTHTHPIKMIDNKVHYGVTNMPGSVPITATEALTNATLPLLAELANKGWKKACKENKHLNNGLNVSDGVLIHPELQKTFG